MSYSAILEQIQSSAVYQQWKKNHADSFLSSILIVITPQKKSFTFHFYDPSRDAISSFIPGDSEVRLAEEDGAILKQPSTILVPLHIEDITLAEEEALTLSRDLMNKEYSSERATSWMLVLHHSTSLQWQVTAFTSSLGIFTAALDAGTGEIINHHISDITSFKKAQ